MDSQLPTQLTPEAPRKRRPRIKQGQQRALEDASKAFDEHMTQVSKEVSQRDNMAPAAPVEDQTKMTKDQIQKYDAPVLKPVKSISDKQKFNEKFRKKWAWDHELVKCIFENHEMIGERIETWTKEYPGDPAEFWQIPVNKPVWAPRLVARKISKCKYHRLVMEERPVESNSVGTIYGAMAVDHVRQRLGVRSVTNFLEAESF